MVVCTLGMAIRDFQVLEEITPVNHVAVKRLWRLLQNEANHDPPRYVTNLLFMSNLWIIIPIMWVVQLEMVVQNVFLIYLKWLITVSWPWKTFGSDSTDCPSLILKTELPRLCSCKSRQFLCNHKTIYCTWIRTLDKVGRSIKKNKKKVILHLR